MKSVNLGHPDMFYRLYFINDLFNIHTYFFIKKEIRILMIIYFVFFQPRPNEAGGKFGMGVIVDKWRKGEVVTIGVDITANHMGYFEFRICPHNNKKRPVTNACLDQNVLKRADGEGHRYEIFLF